MAASLETTSKLSSRINIYTQVCVQDSTVAGNVLIYAAQQLWTKFASKAW